MWYTIKIFLIGRLMVKFLNLHSVNARFESQFKEAFQTFLDSGQYILGQEVDRFETDFASYCGTKYCLGVSNGLDALTLIFKGLIALGRLKENDEVLVPANTFIASILSLKNVGLKPVFVEPDRTTFNISPIEIEKHISAKTKAILVVHLYGQLAPMEKIKSIADRNDLVIIEDAAQAHGAETSTGKKAGNLSHVAAFSFYPTKNLGALGDAGAITTNNDELASVLKKLRNYGADAKYSFEMLGANNRLDEVQAAFLGVKLKYLDSDNLSRQKVANRYLSEINNPKIELPFYDGSKSHVFHLFVVRTNDREGLKKYLEACQIQTMVHYPIPPHKQKAFTEFVSLELPVTERMHNTVLSLPMSPVLSEIEINEVVKCVNAY